MQVISIGSNGKANTYSISQEEFDASVKRSAEAAKDVNKIIKNCGGLVEALTSGFVELGLHEPKAYPGSAGGKMRPWFNEAIRQLFHMMSENPSKEWFRAGNLGSVWFDTELTGAGKTKLTRVTLCPEKRDGKYEIYLDATFDEEF